MNEKIVRTCDELVNYLADQMQQPNLNLHAFSDQLEQVLLVFSSKVFGLGKEIRENSGFVVSELAIGSSEQDNATEFS